jgi:hypothetical protein
MGWREAGWVADNSPYKHDARLVHLILAENADKARDYELPDNRREVARKAAVSMRTVTAVFATMVEDGYLEIVEAPAGKAIKYRFMIPTLAESARGEEPDPSKMARPTLAKSAPTLAKCEIELFSNDKRTKGRATRCPEPFIVNSDMRLWASEHAPLIDVRLETTKFCNYWRAKAGKDATKLDWKLTWRNWLLSAYPPTNGNGHQYRPPAAVPVRETESPDAYVHNPAPMPANLRALIPKEET